MSEDQSVCHMQEGQLSLSSLCSCLPCRPRFTFCLNILKNLSIMLLGIFLCCICICCKHSLETPQQGICCGYLLEAPR